MLELHQISLEHVLSQKVFNGKRTLASFFLELSWGQLLTHGSLACRTAVLGFDVS